MKFDLKDLRPDLDVPSKDLRFDLDLSSKDLNLIWSCFRKIQDMPWVSPLNTWTWTCPTDLRLDLVSPSKYSRLDLKLPFIDLQNDLDSI